MKNRSPMEPIGALKFRICEKQVTNKAYWCTNQSKSPIGFIRSTGAFAQAKAVINAYKVSEDKREEGGKPYACIQTSLSFAGSEIYRLGLWITVFRWFGWWIVGRSVILPATILSSIPASLPVLPAAKISVLLLNANKQRE